MSSSEDRISAHYTTPDLETRILAALKATGKDPEALTLEDLAPVDAFHIRGRMATEELRGWLDIRPEYLVLDVGCGLGGTCRHLAAAAGCRVVGLDLTEEYCRVAEMLSARVGLADLTSFRHGSALALPFEDASFHVVWTEHVQMNIQEKPGFYRELCRVLRPGGRLAFHDIFAGPEDGLRMPVPWAEDPSISYLADFDAVQALLGDLDMQPVRVEERTEASIAFFRKALARIRNDGWMPLGLHLVMGGDAEIKFANLLHNLETNRVRVFQAVMARAPAR